MKNMRRYVVMLLALMVLVVGCGKEVPENKEVSESEKVESSTEVAEESNEAEVAENSDETFLIRAGIGLNDQHPQYKGLEVMKEYVERESSGRIEMQLFHSSQLGDDVQMIEALQLGSQEMTCPSSAPMTSMDNRFMVFDLPFLFPSSDIASSVLDGPLGQELLDGLSDNFLVGLAYWENGYRHITNSVKEIKTPEDMKGLKIRTMENQVHLDFFKSLGANPTPMPFGELFTAMQQGVVDGQENPVPTIYLQNFAEVQDYTTLTGHVYSPFVLLMSKKFWDGLPTDLQAIVQEGALVARDEQRKINGAYTDELVAGLREQGMTVTELSKEELKAFQDATKSTIDMFKEEIGTDYVDSVLAEIERLSE